MLVFDQLRTVADVPLKLSTLVPCVAPKYWPVMVTFVPIAPDARPVEISEKNTTEKV